MQNLADLPNKDTSSSTIPEQAMRAILLSTTKALHKYASIFAATRTKSPS